jgi:hypothetical protein
VGGDRTETYGAVVVSKRICRFLRSCGSGRCCRCFSRLLRRSRERTGEMGVSSTITSVDSFAGMFLVVMFSVVGLE